MKKLFVLILFSSLYGCTVSVPGTGSQGNASDYGGTSKETRALLANLKQIERGARLILANHDLTSIGTLIEENEDNQDDIDRILAFVENPTVLRQGLQQWAAALITWSQGSPENLFRITRQALPNGRLAQVELAENAIPTLHERIFDETQDLRSVAITHEKFHTFKLGSAQNPHPADGETLPDGAGVGRRIDELSAALIDYERRHRDYAAELMLQSPKGLWVAGSAPSLNGFDQTGNQQNLSCNRMTKNAADVWGTNGAYRFDANEDSYCQATLSSISSTSGTEITVTFLGELKKQDDGSNIKISVGDQEWVYKSDDFFGFKAPAGYWGLRLPRVIGKWTHYALVFHNGDVTRSRFYEGGKLLALEATASQLGTAFAGTLFRFASNVDNSMDGPTDASIDEIAIFDRALPADTIQRLSDKALH